MADRVGTTIKFREGGKNGKGPTLTGKVKEGRPQVGFSLEKGVQVGRVIWHVPEASDGRYWQVPEAWIV